MSTMSKKTCFNCESSEGMNFPLFCRDCWRMAILSTVFGSAISEITSRLVNLVIGGQ